MVDPGTDVAAEMFVVGLAFVLVAAVTWSPLWLWIGGPLVVASVVATALRRGDPDVEAAPGPVRQGRP